MVAAPCPNRPWGKHLCVGRVSWSVRSHPPIHDRMTHQALTSAYAVLGLPTGASRWRVRQRYKMLVRRWHPDRFVGDRQGVEEATRQMQAINAAYTMIGAAPESGETARQSHIADEGSRRWTRRDIEEIVNGINEALSPTVRLTASHVLSALLTAGAALTRWMTHDGSEAIEVLLIAALPLACIWFGGIGPGDDNPLQSAMVRISGWIMLILFLSLALLKP